MSGNFILEFQDHVLEIENSNYHLWIPWPRNYTHEKFHEEIQSGRPKSRRLQQPLLAANVNWNSLAVRGLKTTMVCLATAIILSIRQIWLNGLNKIEFNLIVRIEKYLNYYNFLFLLTKFF